MKTDDARTTAPLDPLVRCCLQAGTECGVRWHHFSKVVALPFYPRPGDRIDINDPMSESHGSMVVVCSDYVLDEGVAYVVIGFRECESEDQRAPVDEWFLANGWERG